MSNSTDATTTQTTARGARQFGEMGRWAPYYDLVMALLTLGRETKLRQMEVSHCQLKPGDRVLEIGCGTGTLTLAAKRQVGASGEVVGLDLAPEMVEAARRKASRQGVDVSFRQGSIASIPFPENYFDAVLCSFMIFHMPDDVRDKGISEIHRVLKNGGQLCIMDGVSLDGLAADAQARSFVELEQTNAKFSFIKLWFLRAKAAKA